ncbi:MAG: LysM domain-containing protein, partial [Pseudomonadota bacterium]|nr:LysM domain-containing protein [Pseudomonadota bacterium]
MTRRPRSRAITSGAAALLAGALTAGAPLAIGALATAASAGAARAQAQAQAQPRAETPGRAADGCGEVVVRAGQTLTGIAEAAGETLEALIAANRGRLADPDRIAVGQRLRLPCATEAAAPAGRDAGPGDDRPGGPPADA